MSKIIKRKNVIKDKIIYLKDKDVLWFDSTSTIAFKFNSYRSKNFLIYLLFFYFYEYYFDG